MKMPWTTGLSKNSEIGAPPLGKHEDAVGEMRKAIMKNDLATRGNA